MTVTPQKPQRLGRYFLMDLIAFGGMAEIYRAKTFDNAGNEYVVAIKRVLSNLASNEELIRMLIDEARIASMIHHPCVVRVYEFCQVQDEYFIVMELVDGKDLKTILDRVREIQGAISIADAVYITIGVLTGLHAAHILKDGDGKPLQLIHRDMSPSNILISYGGEVKICDFGIAKTNVSSIQTRTGVVRGKVKYMSPEQAMGWKLDLRTDIYSVGAVLYEMLTNTPPVIAATEVDILKKIKDGKFTPVRQLNPAVPPMLQTIVHKAMAKDRLNRYQSAHEFSQALKQFLNSFSPTYTPAALSQWMEETFRYEHLNEQQAAGQYVFSPEYAQAPQDVGVNLLAEDGSYEIVPLFMAQPAQETTDPPNWLMRETTQVFELSDELLEADPSPEQRETDQFNMKELVAQDAGSESVPGQTDEFLLGPALKVETPEITETPSPPILESVDPEIVEKSSEPVAEEEDFIMKLKDVSGEFSDEEIVALGIPLLSSTPPGEIGRQEDSQAEFELLPDALVEDVDPAPTAEPVPEKDTDPRVKLPPLPTSPQDGVEELDMEDVVEPEPVPATGNPSDAFIHGEIEIPSELEDGSVITVDVNPFEVEQYPNTNPQAVLYNRELVPNGETPAASESTGDFVIELSMVSDSSSGTSYAGEVAMETNPEDGPATNPSIRASVILQIEEEKLHPPQE